MYTPGKNEVIDTIGDFCVGYGICFDVRHPLHSNSLVSKGGKSFNLC